MNLAEPRTIGSLTFGDTDTASAAGWTLANIAVPTNVLTLAGATPANIAGKYNHASGAITVGTLLGAGTLAVNGNLTLGGGAVNLELSPNLAAGGTNDYITVNQLIGWLNNAGASQVEVALTLAGDANLDKTVNFDDLLALAANYNASLSAGLDGDWSLARANVPEPTAALAACIVLTGALSRRGRRITAR